MNIAFDISPTKTGHKVRGTGFYTEQLHFALKKYYPNNHYTFFSQQTEIPDSVALIHYPYFDPFFLTLPLRKQKPTIVTVHDLTPLVFPEHFPAGIKGNLKWQIQKQSLSGAKAILTDSESSKNDILRITGIPSEKIHVSYLAPAGDFKQLTVSEKEVEQLRDKYQIPEKFVLYVGDATWNKNLVRLVAAVQKINLTLVMVGKTIAEKNIDRSNPWNKELVEMHKISEGDKRIITLGFTPFEDLCALYNLATVFAMPSLYEGFGLPILEAMSCGTPVVTTELGSLPEVAGKAAYYVDGYTTDNIADGIGEVFFNLQLQKDLSKKGLEQAKKFSWKKTAEETMAVYQAALLK